MQLEYGQAQSRDGYAAARAIRGEASAAGNHPSEDLGSSARRAPCVERGCRAKSMISVLAGQERRKGRAAGPSIAPEPFRGGSTLSSSARSSVQIASSCCAVADSWRLSGRLSSHASRYSPSGGRAGCSTASCQRCGRDLRSCGLRYCTTGLRCLAARSIAPLSVRVSQSLFLCTAVT